MGRKGCMLDLWVTAQDLGQVGKRGGLELSAKERRMCVPRGVFSGQQLLLLK